MTYLQNVPNKVNIYNKLLKERQPTSYKAVH